MSTETDIFINELKFDAIKDAIKNFFYNNFKYILIIILFLSSFFLVRFLSRSYRKSQLQTYNSLIFRSLVSDKPIEELEKLYKNNDIPSISKILTGINLIGQYTGNSENKERIIQIYNDIFDSEKDLYLKYYSGLNLLIFMLNDKTVSDKKIEELILKLENEINPLLNLVKEQKILFFIKLKKYTEAKNLLDNLSLNKNLNRYFKEKLNYYSDYIQTKLNENN